MKISILPPALIHFTDRVQGGVANGPFVRIHPRFRNDKGLLVHELVHVWQWWLTLGLHSLLYMIVPRYRLWSEVLAMRAQLRQEPALSHRELFLEHLSESLANDYRLRLDQARALHLLTK